MSAEGDPLDRLNASERELLLLLGRGHTAKSIAALKDLSELAVNERFRSARRKTGLGSSREIARLLVAQENRHDFIGLAEPAAPLPDLPRPDADRRASSNRWRLAMTAALLLAAAMFAQQTSVPPPPPQPVNEVADAVIAAQAPAPDVAALHALIVAGPKDPVWSPAMEAALTSTYQRIPAFAGSHESFSVACNASRCEVLAISRDGLSTAEMNAFIQSLQAADLQEAATTLKMDLEVQHLTGTSSQKLVMAAYWHRHPD